MKRTKLADRRLPQFSREEDIAHVITHLIGCFMALGMLAACVSRAARRGDGWDVFAAAVYGATLTAVFLASTIYHSMRPGRNKKILQIIDRCSIPFFIGGTYTVILLSGFRPDYPELAWKLLAFEWFMALLSATMTAIDLKRYLVFAVACYIAMGWVIVAFYQQALQVLTKAGFDLLVIGGVVYSSSIFFFWLGSKKKWIHTVFHVVVLAGAMIHAHCVLLYGL